MSIEKAFNPTRPRYNDEHSSLSDFSWNEFDSQPAKSAESSVASSTNAISSSTRNIAAIENGEQPEQFFTQLDPEMGVHAVEPDEVVESKMISKQNFPQG